MSEVQLTSSPGVYALVLTSLKPVQLKFKRRLYQLNSGCYVYVGSAKGYGGLKARVSRHLKSEKKIRWHIDRLTTGVTKPVCVIYAEDGAKECVLVPCLESLGFKHPLRGFGSSDCREGCTSHTLYSNASPSDCVRLVEEAFKLAGLKPQVLKLRC